MYAVIGWMTPWRSSAAASSGDGEAMAACPSPALTTRQEGSLAHMTEVIANGADDVFEEYRRSPEAAFDGPNGPVTLATDAV